MKYLFIFLPFFAMAQGGDSTLYGVRNDTMFIAGERFHLNGFEVKSSGFYVSDRKPKAVESFKHSGAYYELRENGWYKEILRDTVPENREIRIKGDSVFRWVKEPKWISCDQHIGKAEYPDREKMEKSEVKLLVWGGCSLMEISAIKILQYNEMQVAKNTNGLAVYITETIKVDIVTQYVYEDKWIKNSHVIKEL